MEDQTLTIGIDLHYFMDNDQRHEMDASIHNPKIRNYHPIHD